MIIDANTVVKIELDDYQIEEIVRQDIIRSLKCHFTLCGGDFTDPHADALKTVFYYYSTPVEQAEFEHEFKDYL